MRSNLFYAVIYLKKRRLIIRLAGLSNISQISQDKVVYKLA